MTCTVTVIPNGRWKQNCYIVSDLSTRFSLLIDPGSDASRIKETLINQNLNPVAIVNTHGHYDHIGAVVELMESFDIPFYLNPADDKLMKQANLYKILFEAKEKIAIPESYKELGSQLPAITIGGFKVSVHCTPGHTPGSICLQIGSNLFSGDTLLPNGPGRTDLPGGDGLAIVRSVEFLRNLPDTIKVWPGHGRSFILGELWKIIDQAGAQN